MELEISPGSNRRGSEGKQPRSVVHPWACPGMSWPCPGAGICGPVSWCGWRKLCFTCREPGSGPRCLHLLSGVRQHVITLGFIHQIPAGLRRLYQLLVVNNVQQIAGMDEGEAHHCQQLRGVLQRGEKNHSTLRPSFSHSASPPPPLQTVPCHPTWKHAPLGAALDTWIWQHAFLMDCHGCCTRVPSRAWQSGRKEAMQPSVIPHQGWFWSQRDWK